MQCQLRPQGEHLVHCGSIVKLSGDHGLFLSSGWHPATQMLLLARSNAHTLQPVHGTTHEHRPLTQNGVFIVCECACVCRHVDTQGHHCAEIKRDKRRGKSEWGSREGTTMAQRSSNDLHAGHALVNASQYKYRASDISTFMCTLLVYRLQPAPNFLFSPQFFGVKIQSPTFCSVTPSIFSHLLPRRCTQQQTHVFPKQKHTRCACLTLVPKPRRPARQS